MPSQASGVTEEEKETVMKKCVPFVLLSACFVLAGRSESPPANIPPPARQKTAVTEESQPAMPEPQIGPPATPEPAAHTSGNRVSNPAEKATTVEIAPPSASSPPSAEPAAPNSGRALGNAVRRAFGIPVPATGPGESLGSKSALEELTPKPRPESSKP